MGKGVALVPAAERFWANIKKTDSCWLWTAGERHGYGTIRINSKRRERVHRFSWTLANGPIPDGLGVLHKCDVTLCVRPSHLFVGTQADNIADMIQKGRQRKAISARRRRHDSYPRGSDASIAKLTDDQVVAIRRLKADGLSYAAIGRKYGVVPSNISLICRRMTWKHI